MKKLVTILFFVLFSMLLMAQKTVHKIVDAKAITSIEIDATQVHKLTIKTNSSPSIDISAVMEGEYRDDLIISTKENAGNFKISTAFQPLFQHPNDKLSAHKVVSISMHIVIPEHLNVSILGHTINATVHGDFNTLRAVVQHGIFTMNDFRGNGEVQSFNGAIFVDHYEGKISPFSKYGKISGKNMVNTTSVLTLKTVNGNIYIDKPK